jgi:hypothetical protein
MAAVFDISTVSNTITLDAKRKTQISFTVSNRLKMKTPYRPPLRGRAKVVPLENAKPEWFTITDRPDRDFITDDTPQDPQKPQPPQTYNFNVQVLVPAEVPPGKFSFRLDVFAEDHPDELYSEGPQVTFEVKPAPVPQKPFPWWILIVIVAVCILLGIGAWFFLRTVEVPNVINLTIPAATEKLKSSNLMFELDSPSAGRPPGADAKIVSEEPPPGSQVKPGTSVKCKVQ